MRFSRFSFLAPLLILLALSIAAQAKKKYSFPHVRVELDILEDGRIQVTETRTFRFKGSFKYAYRDVPTFGTDRITDFQVLEKGSAYVRNESKDPGTFWVSKKNKNWRIRLNFRAKNEERTFVIKYTMHGVLQVDYEWAELYYNLLDRAWNRTHERFEAVIRLPKASSGDSLHVWMHGFGTQLAMRPDGFKVSAERLGKKDFVRTRFVFPSSMLEFGTFLATKKIDPVEIALQERLRLEQQAEERAEAFRRRKIAGYIIGVAGLISVVFFISQLLKFYPKGVDKADPYQADQPPSAHHPALVSLLIFPSSLGFPAVMATLLVLSKKGYVRIAHTETKQSFAGKKEIFTLKPTEKQREKLTPWEEHLLDFLIERHAQGYHKMNEVFSKKPTKVQSWQSSWNKVLQSEAKRLFFYNEESKRAAIQHGFIQAIGFILMVFLAFWAGPIGILGIVFFLVMALASFAIYQYTSETQALYNKWSALRKRWKDPQKYGEVTAPAFSILLFGMALYLGKKTTQSLLEQAPALSELYEALHLSTTLSPAELSFVITNVTHSTAFAGSGGAGGGFAGGAGGAAGGGGGGAG